MALLGQKPLTALRQEMRRLHGHNVSPQELATLLVSEVLRPDLTGGETAQMVLRAAAQAQHAAHPARAASKSEPPSEKTHLAKASPQLRPLAQELYNYAAAVGPEVVVKSMRSCIAFRTTGNFCCLDVYRNHFFVVLNLDPAQAKDCAFARDVRGVGHQGTGDLQLRIEKPEQLEKAKELALLSYQRSLSV